MKVQPIVAGLLLATTVGNSVPARAEPPVDSFTLSDLITTAQRDNKDLQAARYAVDIGRARLIEAGLLANPRLDVSGASDFAFHNEGGYSTAVGVSQEFPIAGRILQQKAVARVDIAQAQAEIEDAERKLAGELTTTVYHLRVLDRQIEARDRLIEVDQHLLTTAQARFKAAEVSELDVNTASLDLQRLLQERAMLQSERIAQMASLNPLLGRSTDAPLVINEPLPAMTTVGDIQTLQAKALASRPDLRMAELEADRAHAEKALAQAKRWEDWSVGVALQQDRQVVDGAPGQSIDRALGVNLSIPLPLWNRNQAAIAEAEATGQQARSRVEAVKLGISSEVAAAQRQVVSLQQLLTGSRQTLTPVAQRNVTLAQKGYTQGLVSLLEVVQAQRQAAELENADLDTLDRYTQALARLRTAVSDYPILPASPATAGDAKAP